jgi:hypothetical protein
VRKRPATRLRTYSAISFSICRHSSPQLQAFTT